nr:hypothetical protein REQ54_01758 [Rhizobium sp. Q54]
MMILNVSRNDDGQYEIVDRLGKRFRGPFETNAEAWQALDRLDGEMAVPQKRRRNKRVLWGEPSKGKRSEKGHGGSKPLAANKTGQANAKQTAKQKRSKEKQDRKMRINAAKAPGWVRSVAAVKFDPAGERAYRDHKLGTFGAASEVRRIDPAEYLAEKARGL